MDGDLRRPRIVGLLDAVKQSTISIGYFRAEERLEAVYVVYP